MARALPYTWLSLDEWARIHGFDRLHFNSLTSTGHPMGNCDHLWTQHHWQRGQIAREDVAEAIAQAEDDLARLLGYNLLPDWNADRLPITGHWQRGLLHVTPWRVDGKQMTLNLPRTHWISGGQRATEVLGDGTSVSWPGGDEAFANNRLATLTVALTAAQAAALDTDEVRVYFEPDADLGIAEGDNAWEVRPLESVSLSGTTLTITIRRERLVRPALQEAPPEDFAAADADANASFASALDVIRVYNDPQSMAQLEWTPTAGDNGCGSCTACQIGTQTGCAVGVTPEAGIVGLAPATWDADTETFTTQTLSVCRQPDRVLLYSFSGFQASTARGEGINDRRVMDRELAQLVAILSAAHLYGEACGCEAAVAIEKWQEEIDANLADKSFQVSAADLRNPLGTKRGAMQVWRRVKRRQRPSLGVGAISGR